jgi:hypothetical protein
VAEFVFRQIEGIMSQYGIQLLRKGEEEAVKNNAVFKSSVPQAIDPAPHHR